MEQTIIFAASISAGAILLVAMIALLARKAKTKRGGDFRKIPAGRKSGGIAAASSQNSISGSSERSATPVEADLNDRSVAKGDGGLLDEEMSAPILVATHAPAVADYRSRLGEISKNLEDVGDRAGADRDVPLVAALPEAALVPRYSGEAWTTKWSTPTLAHFEAELMRLPPGENALSSTLPAASGEVWVCEFTAAIGQLPPNGGEANFYIGPIVNDETGKMLTWWQEQPSFQSANSSRIGKVTCVAPAGAVSVRIGILGSYCDPPRKGGNAHIEFSQLRLTRLTD